MQQNLDIVDKNALSRNRERAKRTNLFLHQIARDEIQTRLTLINRKFLKIAIISPFPQIWEKDYHSALIIPDSEILTLETLNHDLIIHAMCLHWSNDPIGQLVQCRHALQPDGLCIAISLGGQTLMELRTALIEAESSLTGGVSPRILPMAEIRELGSLLQRAGFALPVADNIILKAEYKDLHHLMYDLRYMGETNALKARTKKFTRRGIFTKSESIYLKRFSTLNKTISATFELISLTGWTPDVSQQKPQKPGSAQIRLIDALNASLANKPK
ncbi:MAG: SAM-dependent methyltransferase [Aestuariivita sp.]|nr:SAM-dependent methyltransferase [Aestuariivita sp.]